MWDDLEVLRGDELFLRGIQRAMAGEAGVLGWRMVPGRAASVVRQAGPGAAPPWDELTPEEQVHQIARRTELGYLGGFSVDNGWWEQVDVEEREEEGFYVEILRYRGDGAPDVIIFRGTDEGWTDWVETNVPNLVGGQAWSPDAALRLTQNYLQRLRTERSGRGLITAGHSMGGFLSQFVGSVLGVPGYTFNSEPLGEHYMGVAGVGAGGRGDRNSVMNFSVRGDLVSPSSLLGGSLYPRAEPGTVPIGRYELSHAAPLWRMGEPIPMPERPEPTEGIGDVLRSFISPVGVFVGSYRFGGWLGQQAAISKERASMYVLGNHSMENARMQLDPSGAAEYRMSPAARLWHEAMPYPGGLNSVLDALGVPPLAPTTWIDAGSE